MLAEIEKSKGTEGVCIFKSRYKQMVYHLQPSFQNASVERDEAMTYSKSSYSSSLMTSTSDFLLDPSLVALFPISLISS